MKIEGFHILVTRIGRVEVGRICVGCRVYSIVWIVILVLAVRVVVVINRFGRRELLQNRPGRQRVSFSLGLFVLALILRPSLDLFLDFSVLIFFLPLLMLRANKLECLPLASLNNLVQCS